MKTASTARHGEKPLGSFFSFYRFLEDNPGFTYRIRAVTEQNFTVKKKALREHLNLDGWMLDIACGEGFLTELIRPERYVGVDLSESVIRRARKLYRGHFAVMDGTRLGFDDESFDSCLAMDMFHHIRDELLESLISEISRVLKKDGRFLVTDPIKAHFFRDPVLYGMQRLDRGDCFREPEVLGRLLAKHFKVEKHYLDASGVSKWQIYVLAKRGER